MLSTKQFDQLYELLNTKQEILQKIIAKFTQTWGIESVGLFRPCLALSNFLSMNVSEDGDVVTDAAAENSFKGETIRKNPFAGVLFEIYDKTVEHYERKFLCQMLLDNKRDKYAKLKLQIIHEEYEAFLETYKGRDEMEGLKKGYLENVPKTSSTKQSQVRNVLPDFNIKDRRTYPPECPINKDTIKDQELAADGFCASFQLPLPKFIEIHPSQLQWLSPGIIYDVCWDSTYQKEKKLPKIKHLLAKCDNTPLTQDQHRQLLRLMDEYPNTIERQAKIENLENICLKNPSIIVQLLTCMCGSKRFQLAIDKMVKMKLHRNNVEVMGKVLMKFDLGKIVTSYYIRHLIEQCVPSEPNVQRFTQIVAAFAQMCLKNKLIDFKDIEKDLKELSIRNPKVQSLTNLCRNMEGGGSS